MFHLDFPSTLSTFISHLSCSHQMYQCNWVIHIPEKYTFSCFCPWFTFFWAFSPWGPCSIPAKLSPVVPLYYKHTHSHLWPREWLASDKWWEVVPAPEDIDPCLPLWHSEACIRIIADSVWVMLVNLSLSPISTQLLIYSTLKHMYTLIQSHETNSEDISLSTRFSNVGCIERTQAPE